MTDNHVTAKDAKITKKKFYNKKPFVYFVLFVVNK